MIKRSVKFIEVAYFLSKYGQLSPPSLLKAKSWKEAYYMFYEQLNEGRSISAFEHSLKNARDGFDGHFKQTKREGWKAPDGTPTKLSGLSLNVFNKFEKLDETRIWSIVSRYSTLITQKHEVIFDNLIAIEDSEKEKHISKTEGGIKIYISSRVERNPSLRKEALNIHGYDCIVCGFNFEKTYGDWGKEWAEVHHIEPISNHKTEKKQTNPQKDLIVLCANCHRMIHRKRGVVLTIQELKNKLIINS
jgi:5-methylcytosine-specific restriction protein A